MCRKNLKLKCAIIALCFIGGVASLLWAQPAQIMLNTPTRYHDVTFDLENTRKEASVKRQYPPVPFNHELHMGAVSSCLGCHHDARGPKNNQLDESLLVAGNPAARCATCHEITTSAKIQNVYHDSCLTCHEKLEKKQKKAGLALCITCHVPQKIKKYQ